MSRIVVLGTGMVGSAIAADLAKQHDVTCIDNSEAALHFAASRANVQTFQQDLTDTPLLRHLVNNYDLVINATPGHMGFEVLKTVIDTGRSVVDISFFPENPLLLDDMAKQRGVTVMVDMGVAPGMGNVLLGHHDESMVVQSFECLVGGLPKVRRWPFMYKAPFSPVDVIEEYMRPARLKINGELVIRPALSDREWVEFTEVGTLEAFNTDGLRSLLTTMSHIPDMTEKTLRYPGHVELIQALKQTGFFDEQPISLGDCQISPLSFTSAMLKNEWQLVAGEAEFTIMRVSIRGEEGGRPRTYQYHLYDEYDPRTDTSSMARTTGYTCCAAAMLILDERFTDPGVFAPEQVGKWDDCFDYIMAYLSQRGVNYRQEMFES